MPSRLASVEPLLTLLTFILHLPEPLLRSLVILSFLINQYLDHDALADSLRR
ncbi:MAG: hypothetical protein NVSMB1_14470 [Polyangiales bacterium]